MHTSLEIVPSSGDEQEPITVEQLAAHLRLNDTSEEEQLALYLVAARETFEFETGRAVVPTTYRQHMAAWDSPIRLIRSNALEVTAVTYFDHDDQEQELEGWETDITGVPGLVYLPGDNWPALSSTRPRPITVEFVAGWDTDAVPADVRHALLLVAAFFYRHRENYTELSLNELPMGFHRVCSKYMTGVGEV